MKNYLWHCLLVIFFLDTGQAFSQVYNRMWLNTYGNDSVPFSFVPVQSCVDNSGFVYVVSNMDSASYLHVIILIKYNSPGNMIWKQTYVSPNNYDGNATCITIDQGNNILIGGYESNDYLILKYDSAGNFLWKYNYNAVGNESDRLFAIATDSIENVYVTGQGALSGDPYYYTDVVTCKVDSSGNQVWVKYYNYPGFTDANDGASFLKMNASADLFIGGWINGGNSICKYDSSGNLIWTSPLLNFTINDLTLDDSSNIYLTGNGLFHYIHFAKFDSSGIPQWDNPLLFPNSVAAYSIAKDSDAFYVTGNATMDTAIKADVLILKYDLNGDTVWSRHYNSGSNLNDGGRKILVAPDHSLIIGGGAQKSASDYDILVLKYDSAGVLIWTEQDNDNLHSDNFVDAVKDSLGSIFVASQTYYYGNSYTFFKLLSNGNRDWTDFRENFQNSYDGASKIIMDTHGNIIVGGISTGRTYSNDIEIIKYAPDRTLYWKTRINRTIRNNIWLSQMICDSSDNIYLCGTVDTTHGNIIDDMLTAKIDSSGNLDWVSFVNGSANNIDQGASLALDADGFLYVAGCSKDSSNLNSLVMVKYNSAGTLLWNKTLADSALMDKGESLLFDGYNNLYLTYTDFHSWYGHQDIALAKLDTAGNFIWSQTFNGPDSGVDVPQKFLLDKQLSPVIIGFSDSIDWDIIVLKYDSAGNYLWNYRYAGPGNNWDLANDVAVDMQNNIYVTGRSDDSIYVADCFTFKLNAAGNLEWQDGYNGNGSYPADIGNSIAVDNNGRAIVCGSTWDSNSRDNVLIIVYDSSGNRIFTDLYNSGSGVVNDVYGADVLCDQNGSFYMTGQTDSHLGMTDFITMKYTDFLLNASSPSVPNSSLSVYPDPFQNSFNLSYFSTENTTSYIQIFNTMGATVFKKQFEIQSGENNMHFDGLALSPGIYSLQLITPEGKLFSREVVSIK